MSSPYVVAVNALVVRPPRQARKPQVKRKGRDSQLSAAEGLSIPDSASIQTIVVTMPEQDAKTNSEEHLLEDPDSIDILV